MPLSSYSHSADQQLDWDEQAQNNMQNLQNKLSLSHFLQMKKLTLKIISKRY